MKEDEALERLLRAAGPRETAADDRVIRVRTAVHETWRYTVRARARRRWLTIGGLGIAAAAAALVMAVLWRTPNGPNPAAPPAVAARLVSAAGPVSVAGTSKATLRVGDTVAVGAMLATTDRSRAALAIEGGGELRLDTGTTVRLVAQRRIALDRGGVYLDAGTSAGAGALTIDTPAGTIRDIGTRFEVRLNDGTLRVRVREGAVRLERAAMWRDAAAGTELLATAEGAIDSRASAVYGPDWAWLVHAAPPFSIEGRTLAALLGWAAREGGWTIEFADPALAAAARTTILHGSIEGLTTEEALAAILPTCGLSHRIERGRVIVWRSAPPGSTW